MPSLRSQQLTSNGFTITASDGRSFTITKAQAITIFQVQTGTVPQRVAATLLNIGNQIVTALGPEQITLADIAVAFDGANINSIRFGH